MKLSESVKPISYFKAHASEVIRNLSKNKKTMIITHNGEAKAIIQDIHSYEQTRDSLALLKILAQSSQSLKRGKTKPFKKAFHDLRKRIADHEES